MLLEKSCGIVLSQCMGLQKNESCLIITDSKLFNIGNALYKYSSRITNNSKLIKIPIPESHGSEPPHNVAAEMLRYDVVLMPTTKSLSHTTARKKASKNGARIASMPGITGNMMERALNVDFNKIKAKSIDFVLFDDRNKHNHVLCRRAARVDDDVSGGSQPVGPDGYRAAGVGASAERQVLRAAGHLGINTNAHVAREDRA